MESDILLTKTDRLTKLSFLFVLTISTCLLFSASFFFSKEANASLTNPVDLEGYAWSSNIGWISFNCSDLSICGTSNYKVTMNTDLTLTGFAWSDNVGWIKFGSLSSFPAGGSNAEVKEVSGNDELTGWARACSGTSGGTCSSMTNYSSDWDGWISFNCDDTGGCGTSDYSVDVAAGSMTGYAWGGDIIGWVSFWDVTYSATPTATLEVENVTDGISWTGSDITIDDTDDINFQWSSTDADSCSGTYFTTGGATSGTDNSPTQPAAGANLQYILSCTGIGGTTYDFLNVNAHINCTPSISADEDITREGNSVNISWDANCGGGNLSNCSVDGPGLSVSPLTVETGNQSVSPSGEATYAIDCRADKSSDPGSSTQYDAVTVKILPSFEET